MQEMRDKIDKSMQKTNSTVTEDLYNHNDFKCKGLNSTMKRQRLEEWINTHGPLHIILQTIVCKRFTLDLKSYID